MGIRIRDEAAPPSRQLERRLLELVDGALDLDHAGPGETYDVVHADRSMADVLDRLPAIEALLDLGGRLRIDGLSAEEAVTWRADLAAEGWWVGTDGSALVATPPFSFARRTRAEALLATATDLDAVVIALGPLDAERWLRLRAAVTSQLSIGCVAAGEAPQPAPVVAILPDSIDPGGPWLDDLLRHACAHGEAAGLAGVRAEDGTTMLVPPFAAPLERIQSGPDAIPTAAGVVLAGSSGVADAAPTPALTATGSVLVLGATTRDRELVVTDVGRRSAAPGPFLGALLRRAEQLVVVGDAPDWVIASLAGHGVLWIHPTQVATGRAGTGAAALVEPDTIVWRDVPDPLELRQLTLGFPSARRVWAGPAPVPGGLAELFDDVVASDAPSLPRGPVVSPITPAPAVIAPVETVAGLVSVVIPVHGRIDLTERCLDAIRATTEADVEVIVVDDASPDDTRSRLAGREDVTVVALDENLGFPGAVNRGIAATRGELVCILNNDTVPVAGWLDELRAQLEDPAVGLVGPRTDNVAGLQRLGAEPRGEDRTAWARRWAGEHRGDSWPSPVLVGFCWLARRETFERLGGLDERFGRGNFEDQELCHRIRRAGLGLRVADGAVVLHEGSATFGALATGYDVLLAAAARQAGEDRLPVDPLLTTIVLSDGEADAAARTAASAATVAGRTLVLERAQPDVTRMLCGPGVLHGVEVVGVDWQDPAEAGPVVEQVPGQWLLVLAAGEELRHLDVGAVRAEIEHARGEALGLRVGDRSEIRLHRRSTRAMDVIGEPTTEHAGSVAVGVEPPGRPSTRNVIVRAPRPEPCVIELPRITDARGNLTFVEGGSHLPFDIQRVYYLYDVPGGEARGGHAHRRLESLVIAASGSFEVVLDDGHERRSFFLNRSWHGVYIPPMTWRELHDFSSGSVCLVLASRPYEEDDYLRDYDSFRREATGR
jgi:GT2 family glycosyltransferase